MGQLRDLAKRQLHANDLKISALLKENTALKAKVAELTAHNSRYATALHDIGKVIDGDYGDMTMTQSFEQIRTIVQGFNTASERYCA